MFGQNGINGDGGVHDANRDLHLSVNRKPIIPGSQPASVVISQDAIKLRGHHQT